MFRCGIYSGQQKFLIAYCAAEKTLLALDVLILILLTYQLVFVYRRNYRLNFQDRRLQILSLCIAASLYFLIHYGVLPHSVRGKAFVMTEFFRSSILYAICLYYCAKASGLLKNRKLIIFFLSLCFFVGALLLTVSGIWAAALVWSNTVNPQGLCSHW